MLKSRFAPAAMGALVLIGLGVAGCRNHMPHRAFTWPAGGDVVPSHAKPPEGGYYENWDPYAATLEVAPVEDVNPVRTQHVLVATVRDDEGKPLPNRRVEWIISEGSVGDIVEVDESGWRASRGYKVDNHYAVSHTNNYDHVLDMGTDDPSDDIQLEKGSTWCVITSPIEGDTHVTVYAPGIYDWSKHKVFALKHWYDVAWEFPPAATNPTGTQHQFVTQVTQYSDGAPLPNYIVTYTILDGPAGRFEESGGTTATVQTDANGMATVTLAQQTPAEGTNNVEIDIMRPANEACCKPAVHIATGQTAKTWVGPKIACDKTAPSNVLAGETFAYTINVSNPSPVDATNVQVTDTLPSGVEFVSSDPPTGGGQSLSWNLGSVAGNSSRTVTVNVRATGTGTFENCAEVRADQGLSSRCCATTTATAPALALEKSCTPEITVCDMIEYTIVVRNTGDGPAVNVQVTDQLPAGISLADGRTSVSENLGTLQAGEAKQIRYSAKAGSTGTFTNNATATADGGLTASDSCTTRVTQPVLTITKSGPDLRYIGRTADYQITVSNAGDAPARDTVVTDTLPGGTQFVSASDGGSSSGGTVNWSLGTLNPGESRTLSLTVRTSSRGEARNVVHARAVCAEAQAETLMRVEGIAAILLEVIDVEDPIEVGANETYLITVTNQGSAEDTNIVIECIVPPEMEYVSSDGLVQATTEGARVRFAPLPSLAPGAKAEWRLVVRGVTAADARLKVIMNTDQTTSPVEETESTHVYE